MQSEKSDCSGAHTARNFCAEASNRAAMAMDGQRRLICNEVGMPQSRQTILALQQRSFDFTCGVVNAHPKTQRLDDASRVIWHQLLKAAASATFNLEEADAASSGIDFIAKMRIALREAKESRVAIRVIVRCQLSGWSSVARFEDEAGQLAAIFATIILRKKANLAKPK